MTKMQSSDLELKNKSSNTALCLAAAAGNLKMVEIMVRKNSGLVAITGSGQMPPLYLAALFGHYEMTKSHKLGDDCWTAQNRAWLLVKCVETDMFDIALQIVKDRTELGSNGSVLGVLAKKTDVFAETESNIFKTTIEWVWTKIRPKVGPSKKDSKANALELLKIIWKNIAEMSTEDIDKIIRGPPDPIKQDASPEIARKLGNTRFIIELIRLYPDLIWKVNDDNQSIFHTAVKHSHEGIYNLLGSMKDLITPLKDTNGNNMLHLVGKSAKKKRLEDVSGVAFQMQRELLL